MNMMIATKRMGFSLTFSVLTLIQTGLVFARSVPVIVNGNLTREALFDTSISSASLVQEIQEAGLNVNKAILNSIRMNKGKYFTEVGKIASFDYIASSHSTRHAVSYYIPISIKNDLYGKTSDVAPVLVIMHGGGASTSNYSSAKSTAELYMRDFLSFAEENKTIIIAPSTSLGWSAHTSFLMREVNAIARKELNVSGDRFYLFGHSMGAMGITRSASNMADEYAGFLPTAGGMESWARTEANLRPYLNINFTHINGINDHFGQFAPNLIATEAMLKSIAHKERMPLNFKALFHGGDHQYNLPLTLSELKKLMAKKRDLYQPKLFAYMGRGVLPANTSVPIKDFIYPHFFWAKANKLTTNEGQTTYSHWNFEVYKEENTIELNNFSGAKSLKNVTIFVSSKLLDLNRPVRILAQGKKVFDSEIKADPAKTIDIVRGRGDSQFLFDQALEIKLN